MFSFFSRSKPADEMQRAVAAYEKVVSLGSDSRDARSLRLRMGLICRAHLDKTFVAGAEQTAAWQELARVALIAGKPLPEVPVPSKFQQISTGDTEICAYLPEEYVVEAFGLGSRYQKMDLSASKAAYLGRAQFRVSEELAEGKAEKASKEARKRQTIAERKAKEAAND